MGYKLEWIGNNVFVNFSDELNLDQIYQADNTIYGDSRFDKMKYQIIDLTNVDTINLTSHEIKIVTVLERNASRWNKSIKIAFITKNKDMKKMLLEYIKGMQDTNWLCMIFSNINDAKKWCSE